MKKTILIFGVSSFVGSNLLETLKDEYRIIGTYHSTPVSIKGVTCLPCDVLKKEYVSNLLKIFKPDMTIYAVGLSSLKGCLLEPKMADALNSVGAINCCVASERIGSKFIFISSGFVLAGQDTFYREGETPFPNTIYGNSLSSTEFYIQRSCLNYLILRCSPLYGRGYHVQNTWFESLQTALAKNEPFLADDSVFTGFLDVQIMVKALKAALNKGATNRLFHVSSKDFMTRYEFAKCYAKTFRKDESLIQKMIGQFPGDRKSNSDSTNFYYRLDTSNIEEFLGAKMPRIEESLSLSYKRLGSI